MSDRVRTAGLFPAFLIEQRKRRAALVKKRAREYQALLKEEHKNAPRGGSNLNKFGEPRSAPGEPPAMETGALYAQIDQGLEANEAKREATVIANYKVLEDGTRRIEPRPLARIAMAKLKDKLR